MTMEGLPTAFINEPIERPALTPGQQFTALPFLYGGIEGLKYHANLNGNQLFVRRGILDEFEPNHHESEFYQETHEGKIYQKQIWRTIAASRAFSKAAEETNKHLNIMGGQKVEISPILPLALLRSRSNGAFTRKKLDLIVDTILTPDVFAEGLMLDKIFEQSLTTNIGKLRTFKPDKRLALALPFINNFGSYSLWDSLSPASDDNKHTKLSTNLALKIGLGVLKLNQELMKRGLMWEDQQKSDAYLLIPHQDGSLSVTPNDIDTSVINHKRFKNSDIYWDKAVERGHSPYNVLHWLRELVGLADDNLFDELTTDRDSERMPWQTLDRWIDTVRDYHERIR